MRTRCAGPARSYAASFQKYYGGNGRPIYASKAFSCKEIYRIVVSEGLDVEVVSGGELYTALQAGVPREEAPFPGEQQVGRGAAPGCGERRGGHRGGQPAGAGACSSRTAKEHGVRAGISLRVKPGIDAHTHEFIRTGQVDSKFGLDLQNGEALEAVKQALAAENLELQGLHCHIGSQILEKEPFVHAAEVMLDFYGLLRRELGVTLKHLNLGGGFGIHYKEEDAAIPYEEYMEVVSAAVHRKCGGAGPAPALHLYRARPLHRGGGRHHPVHRGGHQGDPRGAQLRGHRRGACSTTPGYALYQADYTCLIANKADRPADYTATIAGKCCESGDLIQEHAPYPEAGDRGHPGGALHRGVQLFHGLQLQPEPEAPLRDGLPGQLPGHHQGGDLRGPGAQRHLTPGV